jgi:ribose transport system ATP-binding protein
MNQDVVLSVQDISKTFSGTRVLNRVNMEVNQGEVFGVVGENGAGKSTLMKILTGVYDKDAGGKFFLDGKECNFKNYDDAYHAGIVMLFQEISLIPNLTVAENMFIDKYDKFKNRLGLLDRRLINREARKALDEIGSKIDLSASVSTLNVIEKRMVEIGKVIYEKKQLVIMDEPTAPLSSSEVETLFSIIRRIKAQTSVIFISHHFEEIFAICDRVLVLRDSQVVGVENTKDIDKQKLVAMMVGESIDEKYYDLKVTERKSLDSREAVLTTQNLSKRGSYENISFKLHKGEIVGFAGLLGSGTTDLGRTLFGLDKREEGTISYKGIEKWMKNPREAVAHNVVYLPPDRRNDGVILTHSIKQNIAITCMDSFKKYGYLDLKKEEQIVRNAMNRLDIKASTTKHLVDKLSGGNQQKVMVAKWLGINADIIIFDSPTVGIDIKTKDDIYRIIYMLSDTGISVIVISSDFPELQKLCDRIFTMSKGRITHEFQRADKPTEADILRWVI